MIIQATVPSGLGVLFTPWPVGHCAADLWAGHLLRTGKFTATTVSFSVVFHLAFAVCLSANLA